MSVLTKILELFKYDPNTDGAQTFNIDQALNANWDKVDTFAKTAKDHMENRANPHNVTAEQIGAVTSFNGRSGTVVPEAGDYTPEMVGAVTEEYVNQKITTLPTTEDLDKLNAIEFSIVLSAQAWKDNAQTISNVNLTNDAHAYLVSPGMTHIKEYTGAQIYAEDITTSGTMVFRCVKKPGSDITVNILKVVKK